MRVTVYTFIITFYAIFLFWDLHSKWRLPISYSFIGSYLRASRIQLLLYAQPRRMVNAWMGERLNAVPHMYVRAVGSRIIQRAGCRVHGSSFTLIHKFNPVYMYSSLFV